MILIGEIEYTNCMMAPDGFTGFLFVSTEYINNETRYCYSVSPYQDSPHVGDKTIFTTSLSVTEFLQYIVDHDTAIGRNASIKFKDDVGVKLKGMENWITRTPLNNFKT